MKMTWELEPLSKYSLEAVLSEVSALSDSELSIEAEAINSNFIQWLKDHFIISKEEVKFLNGIDESAIKYFGAQCAYCFIHDRDIFLSYPAPPIRPGYKTFLAVHNSITPTVNAIGEDYGFGGSILFEVCYKYPMYP